MKTEILSWLKRSHMIWAQISYKWPLNPAV